MFKRSLRLLSCFSSVSRGGEYRQPRTCSKMWRRVCSLIVSKVSGAILLRCTLGLGRLESFSMGGVGFGQLDASGNYHKTWD